MSLAKLGWTDLGDLWEPSARLLVSETFEMVIMLIAKFTFA